MTIVMSKLDGTHARGAKDRILNEIILQSKVEFNYEEVNTDEDQGEEVETAQGQDEAIDDQEAGR